MNDTPILGKSLKLVGALVGLSSAWVVLAGLVLGTITDRVLDGLHGTRDETVEPAADATGGAAKQPPRARGSLGSNSPTGSKPNG
jgi:hypothetical protein